MKSRKFIATILLVATISVFSGGCVRKEKPQIKKTTKVELVYYKLFDDEDSIVPLIQQYRSKYPNVNIKYRKFVDPIEYENLILNQLAEGEGPDIFSMPNHWFLRNIKKLSPMPVKIMSPKQFEQTFVDVASNDLLLDDPFDSERKVFGLPLSVDTLALYYNKAFFEDKIPARGRPATTWEVLNDDISKLNKTDNSFERFEVAGIAMGRSDNISRALDMLYTLMLQYKARFYNENVSQATFASQQELSDVGTFSNPASSALRLYTSYALPANKNYSWNAYLASSNSKTKELETFASGKVAMIFGYSYLYEQLKAVLKDLKDKSAKTMDLKNIKISAMPQLKDPSVAKEKRVTYANYYAETVARASKHSAEAWDFLLFLSSKENMKFYNEKTHRPTSRRDMIEDQKKDPIYGVFAEQNGFAESFPIYDAQRYNEIFTKMIDSVLATTPVEAAVKVAEESISAMLPKPGLLPLKTQKKTQQQPAGTGGVKR